MPDVISDVNLVVLTNTEGEKMASSKRNLLRLIGIKKPIIQAPMAGVSTPEMAAAVTNAGGLGSLGVGAMTAENARTTIEKTQQLTTGPININVFCHPPAEQNVAVNAAWMTWLTPQFAPYGVTAPTELREIYTSFLEDEAMLNVILERKPKVVSCHFGLPSSDAMRALKAAGIVLIASATSVEDARMLIDANIDGIIAQGYEAGGHRGVFDTAAEDLHIGSLALTRLLVKRSDTPVITAGGVMDGAGILACLALGAQAAQLGTAFVPCTESAIDDGYRAALCSPAAFRTVMTSAISGRPARAIANRFTKIGEDLAMPAIPAYPIAYDAGKALHAAAKASGEGGYGAQWAGQAAALARALSAAELVRRLSDEMAEALAQLNTLHA